MIPARAEAAFWAGFLRNRNVDGGTALDGAIPVAGGFAIYAAGTALDYTLGAGTARPLQADDLAVVEEFYAARAHPAQFELDQNVLERDGALFRERGYDDGAERIAVLEGPAAGAPSPPNGLGIAVRATTDRRSWIALAGRAFADGALDASALQPTLQAGAAAAHVLTVASLDGQDVGVGALAVFGELALLWSAAVLAPFRRRGVHAALVAARLDLAHRRGASRATLKTAAGSPAERTAVRLGFARTGLRTRLRRIPG